MQNRLWPRSLRATSDVSYAVLAGCVHAAQGGPWHEGADPAALSAASWAFAHELAVLYADVALARRQPGVSLD